MSGRPILGVIAGFFFGFLLGITLFLFGVIPLHSDLILILPILGIVLGLVMAWSAPFGGSEPPAVTSPPLTSPDPDPEGSSD
jgi:hypothetical protein